MRIEVVPDEPANIARSVKALSELVGESGFVFTSGGIGRVATRAHTACDASAERAACARRPTHDDVSYEAIASAYGRGLPLHPPTVERMREHYAAQGKELNAARLRMATLPEGCVVHTTPGAWVPLAQVHNVFILPGVPVRHAQRTRGGWRAARSTWRRLSAPCRTDLRAAHARRAASGCSRAWWRRTRSCFRGRR